MKKFLKKILVGCLVTVSVLFGVACKKETKVVSELKESTSARVVIYVVETEGEPKLIDCMEQLKKDGTFSYTIEGGMVTQMNGKANGEGYWMLYTSDSEMGNDQWGTMEYNGETLESAILGADALVVEENELYVWVYQIF